jgi:exonuclease V gamma subunit
MDMRKMLVLSWMWIAVISGYAQESDVRQISGFHGVRASDAIDVYLKKGDKESIRVEVSGVSVSDVITEIAGSYLRIHMRSGNYRGKRTIKVYVTYLALDRISASSASNIFSEGEIKSNRMDISVSSAASVEATLDVADEVAVEASSAGNVVLEGKTKSCSVEASSAGDVDAYRLEAQTVHANTSSAGVAKVNVTQALQADASSGGTIRYRGNPSNTMTNAHSGGSVKKAN